MNTDVHGYCSSTSSKCEFISGGGSQAAVVCQPQGGVLNADTRNNAQEARDCRGTLAGVSRAQAMNGCYLRRRIGALRHGHASETGIATALRSQTVTLRSGRGQHRKYLPLAFTEHGAIMAAMILNSPRAIQMSVYVVRAFVRSRQSLSTNKDLARELDALKRSVATLDADARRHFDLVYEAILGLMALAPKQ